MRVAFWSNQTLPVLHKDIICFHTIVGASLICGDDILIANLVLIIHFCVVAFVTSGLLVMPIGYLFNFIWTRNRRLRLIHIALLGFITVEALLGITCPLTYAENLMRGVDYQQHFVSYWLSQIIYWDLPSHVFGMLYAGCLLWSTLFWKIHPPIKTKHWICLL